MRTVQVPTIGDVIELSDGQLWKIRSIVMLDSDQDAFPNSRTLYFDVDPVPVPLQAIPESIRRSMES